MANKVFQFGSVQSDQEFSQKKLPSLEKYKDISMLSKTIVNADGNPAFRVSKSVNVQAIRNSLRNIFTWIPGERILLPEFGSRLHMLLYEGITPMTEERIIAEIRSNVSEWEPRVQIVDIRNVSTTDDTEGNTIAIDIVFTIPSLSEEQYIYSFTYDLPQ